MYCAKEHWGTNTRIIYCDDDRYPEKTWLRSFINSSYKNPNSAIVSHGFNLTKFGLNSRFPKAKKLRVINNPRYIFKRILQKLNETISGEPSQKPARIEFKKSGFVDIASGLGGCSIKPEFFCEKAFQIPEIIWTVDDIWLSGMLEYRDIGIWASNSIPVPIDGPFAYVNGLYNFKYKQYDRHSAELKCVKYMQEKFNIWK